jgi:transcriptional regulator with XRE-family HTH domain
VTKKVNISTKTDAPSERMNDAIARRIAALRKDKGLSFDDLAARSGVSKGMLVQLEQGRANPSIATLCKLAESLRVSVADLVAAADETRSLVHIVAADSMPLLWQGSKGGQARLLVGSGGPDMLELWEWVLLPGERYESRPHPRGTQELIHVREGTLILEVAGVAHTLGKGASAYARTDHTHAYQCGGRARTRFSMAVLESAPGAA